MSVQNTGGGGSSRTVHFKQKLTLLVRALPFVTNLALLPVWLVASLFVLVAKYEGYALIAPSEQTNV